jgi:hypothetical protein
MSDTTRKSHLAFIQEVLIPYYKKAGIASFAAITPASVTLLQDYLLSTGIKPQSVNRYIQPVETEASSARFSVATSATSL